MALILVISHGLGLQFANYPLVGMRGVIAGIAIRFMPGLIGAWIAVDIVRQIETRVLNTQRRRDFATRTIIALIVFGPAFIVCTGVQFKLFSRAEEWWPLCWLFRSSWQCWLQSPPMCSSEPCKSVPMPSRSAQPSSWRKIAAEDQFRGRGVICRLWGSGHRVACHHATTLSARGNTLNFSQCKVSTSPSTMTSTGPARSNSAHGTAFRSAKGCLMCVPS